MYDRKKEEEEEETETTLSLLVGSSNFRVLGFFILDKLKSTISSLRFCLCV